MSINAAHVHSLVSQMAAHVVVNVTGAVYMSCVRQNS